MKNFEELSLPKFLDESLKHIGFNEPTLIQKKSIPDLMKGRDLLACAETGSGKTGAYLIPMLAALHDNPKSQGLVLAPTRELAQQIHEFLCSITPNPRQFHTTKLIGGQDIRKQFKSLQRKPRVIVATPGRLIDHLKRNTIQIHKVEHLVVDEGDRMIDMGFAPQLQQILKHLPENRQTAFFTATLDKKVKDLTQKYLTDPVNVILSQSRPVSKIKQSVVQVELKKKNDQIVQELNERKGSIIIFLKTKSRTDRLSKHLLDYGFAVNHIHGGRTQGQRNQAIKSFKDGKSRILCATDVAARGIDVPSVEHVINFDLPMQEEDYVHRVGRTARNGASGEALSFVTPEENRVWNQLAKRYEIPNATLTVTERPKKKFKSKSKSGSKAKSGSKSKFSSKARPNSKSKKKSSQRSSRGPKGKSKSARR